MKERKKFSVLAGTIILFLVVILLGYTGRAEAAGKVQLKNTTISVYKTVYTYNGRVQKPAVSVRYRGKKLSVNKDYTLVYSKGRKNPGVSGRRHDFKAHLETSFKGGFRLSDPLFDPKRFQRGKGSDHQWSHKDHCDLKEPETRYPLLPADPELLPLCEGKICLFRLVRSDGEDNSEESRFFRQYRKQWNNRQWK